MKLVRVLGKKVPKGVDNPGIFAYTLSLETNFHMGKYAL